jgi:hypothetical protein
MVNKIKRRIAMFDFDFDTEMVQEASYDAASSGFKDLFDEKFTSFNPENIVSTGNNKLRSGMFDMDIEDSDLAIGYKNDPPAATPRPGRFMD